MKRSKLGSLRPLVLTAVGVFLGRGAQADTILTFDELPPGQANNSPIIQGFGSQAASSSPGVSVDGFGTPNIRLSWFGVGYSYAQKWYYSFGNAALSSGGDRQGRHDIYFTPEAGFAVRINSFRYWSAEPFPVSWYAYGDSGILARGDILYGSSGQPPINVTGAIGEGLTLSFNWSLGYNVPMFVAIGLDDISFAQVPEPGTVGLLSLGGLAALGLAARRRRHRRSR